MSNPETSLPQTPNPSESSAPPTPVPTPNPTESPVAPFTPLFPISRPVAPPAVTSGIDYTNILLTANTRISRNEVLYSPNGQFSIFLTSDNGDLVLMDNTNNIVVWRANAGGGAQTCNLQPDGNMLLRRSDGSVTWSTQTSAYPGASLRLDDGGQLSLMVEDGIPIWLAGIPRGQYNNHTTTTTTTHTSLTFPIRGAFYYPWFPKHGR
ncbi:Di-hem cytochrome c peroxidase [Fragilaria crotonensis]|nr:Di-hem cytochrome c peroxidase [Fragilaria crotonensis]